jgi:hypothetical protein
MLVGALAAARVFAYCTGDRTAALRAWLMSLRASLAETLGRADQIAEPVIGDAIKAEVLT